MSKVYFKSCSVLDYIIVICQNISSIASIEDKVKSTQESLRFHFMILTATRGGQNSNYLWMRSCHTYRCNENQFGYIFIEKELVYLSFVGINSK